MPPYFKSGGPYEELSPSGLLNGKALELQANANEYSLELNSVSYIRSFTTGKWYSKIFNPPITAQFLKDINLELRGGEIMGVIGSSGCGKTTLLKVIARKVQGSTGGAILLNRRPLTESSFASNGAYLTFNQELNPSLSVRETLDYQAELGLAPALGNKETKDRVSQLMRDFELMDYSRRRVEKLHESARRRLLIAYHLIRDPLILMIDDLPSGLDPLSVYQTMYLLSQYMKKYNRMALIAMAMPRSDVYPLLDRLTLLFFGEIIYTGYTKLMPQYFRSIGYPCPATENPAIYFVSLATVDRETSERYLETQEQAVKLIDVFKAEGYAYVRSSGNPNESAQYLSRDPYLPLCQLGQPGFLTAVSVLMRRSLATYACEKATLFWRLFLLPIYAVFLFFAYYRITDSSPSAPQTIGGLLFNCMTAVSMIAVGLTSASFDVQRNRYYQERAEGLFKGATFALSQLVAPLLFDLISVTGFAAIVYWACLPSANALKFALYATVLWCCFQFATLQTMCLMAFGRSAFRAASLSLTLVAFHVVAAGGYLKNLRDYYGSPSDWLYWLTYGSIYRYAGAFLQFQELHALNNTGCRDARIFQRARFASSATLSVTCRWDTGMDYLNEIYRDSDMKDTWFNFIVCLIMVGAMWLLTLVLFALPMPHFVRRKFVVK